MRNFWQSLNPVSIFSKQTGYIEVPLFDIDYTWKDVPTIVAVYNYASNNNFAIKPVTKPTGSNYVLCIKYRIDNTVYRYKLWESEEDVIIGSTPVYNGEIIKKNFQIEVWCLDNSGNITSDSVFNIPVGIKRNKTTLQDVDTYKHTEESVVVTSLGNANSVTPSTTEPDPLNGGTVNAKDVSSQDVTPTTIDCEDGYMVFNAGRIAIDWIHGVYQNGNTGEWLQGLYNIVNAENPSEVLGTFGSALGWVSEAVAIAQATPRFYITLPSNLKELAIINVGADAGNTDGADTPRFLVQPYQLSLPLTFSTSQNGTNNI